MTSGTLLLSWAGLGAGLMYLFDPDRGRRRRAVLRDGLASAAVRATRRVNLAAHDLSHRATGLVAEARAALTARSTGPVPGRVLAERVRAALGRAVSHPHAIRVATHDGRVTLTGPILAREVGCLLGCVSAVRGVTGVDNQLEVHERADVSALQDGRTFPRGAARWSTAARLVACAAGGGLMANCLARRTPGAVLLGTVGCGLFLRGLTNADPGRLAGRLTSLLEEGSAGAPGTRVARQELAGEVV